MKAPCKTCWERKEVRIHTDGKLYCEECHPDPTVSSLFEKMKRFTGGK